MEELQGAPVSTDRSRVAMGRGQRQMPGQEDRTVRGYRNQGLVPELENVIRNVLAEWVNNFWPNGGMLKYSCIFVKRYYLESHFVFWEYNIQ